MNGMAVSRLSVFVGWILLSSIDRIAFEHLLESVYLLRCRLPRLNKFQICNSEYKMKIACYPIIVPSVALLWYQSLSLIESNCLFSLFLWLQNVIFICSLCFCRLLDESSIKSFDVFRGYSLNRHFIWFSFVYVSKRQFNCEKEQLHFKHWQFLNHAIFYKKKKLSIDGLQFEFNPINGFVSR